MKVAYLVSRYPAVTHTFILREVRMLRALGLDVRTISIARVGDDQLLSEVDREEARSTFNVRPVGALALASAHLTGLLRSPSAYASTLATALRLSPGGARGALWQLFYFVQAMRVWQHCRRRGIRHLHVHHANVAADVALLVVAYGRAAGEAWSWSLSMHGPTEFSDVEAHRLREKAESAEFVACISSFARSQLMAIVDPARWGRLELVRLGVDPQEFEPGSPGGGAEATVLVVGQVARRKGHEVLLRAMTRMSRPARLVVVGDGPERARLERVAAELGLEGRVEFAGARGQHEIRDFYRAADVFCLPSFQEGVPVVLMEAMATGVPVVATRIMGVPELVEDGQSGLLVAPGAEEELAAAIDHLLADSGRAAAIGAAGRERVERLYDLRANVPVLAELLRRVGTGVDTVR